MIAKNILRRTKNTKNTYLKTIYHTRTTLALVYHSGIKVYSRDEENGSKNTMSIFKLVKVEITENNSE